MHFVVIFPLWLAIILWIIKIVVVAVKKDSKVTVVQRMITAPDGRQATFVVPVDEPASVSIGRMYPDGMAVAQGTVLAKFGEANGWTQVGVLGADGPEGWVANSTIMPAAP